MQLPERDMTLGDPRLQNIKPKSDCEVIQAGDDDNVLRCTPDGTFYVEETIYRYVTAGEARRYYIASWGHDLDFETARDLKLIAERFNHDPDDLLRDCLAWALRENAEGRGKLFERRESEGESE